MSDKKVLFCSEETREAAETIFGTATEARLWLLLEYHGPWHAQAVEDNELPQAVHDYLLAQEAADPQTRVLFIKQQQATEDGIKFFVLKTAETNPTFLEFDLSAYEDLLALDIAALSASNLPATARVRTEPLFIVCANGKRDKCCAKFGLAAYRALAASEAASTWQSSHIGGHRYAPNILLLPHCINYGLQSPDEVLAAVAAYRSGQLADLASYRGRTFHAPQAQAAEVFLRRELQLFDIDGVQLLSATNEEGERWRVQFDLSASGERHEVTLNSGMTADARPTDCSPLLMKTVPRHEFLNHSVMPAVSVP